MTREEELYSSALEVPAAVRAAWLQRACGGDQALHARVAAWLAANRGAEAFRPPPPGTRRAGPARDKPGEGQGADDGPDERRRARGDAAGRDDGG